MEKTAIVKLREIEKKNIIPHRNVIFLTANCDEQEKTEILDPNGKYKAKFYLSKPFNPINLVALLKPFGSSKEKFSMTQFKFNDEIPLDASSSFHCEEVESEKSILPKNGNKVLIVTSNDKNIQDNHQIFSILQSKSIDHEILNFERSTSNLLSKLANGEMICDYIIFFLEDLSKIQVLNFYSTIEIIKKRGQGKFYKICVYSEQTSNAINCPRFFEYQNLLNQDNLTSWAQEIIHCRSTIIV